MKDIDNLLKQVKQANSLLEILTIGVSKRKTGYTLRIRARSKGLRFEKHTFPLTKDGLKSTIKICHDIETDYYRDCFDSSLVKYGLAVESAPKLIAVESAPNLLEIWNNYKELKPDVSGSTKRNRWVIVDRWLSQCPSECLILTNADKLLPWLRSKYADGTIKYALQTLSSAVNLAVKLKKVNHNPIPSLLGLLKPTSRKQIQVYTKAECKVILQAFQDGRYDNDYNDYSSSFYAGFIEFRMRTGCRPSEAIALTWSDVKTTDNAVQIVFSKRYSGGELLQKTKNGVESRTFPCNQGMVAFLNNLPRIDNPNNLIFPSRGGNYLKLHNFNRRWWRPITDKLCEEKLISKKLPFYDLRHGFITELVRSGIDPKTIASLVGNSSEVIFQNYLAVDTEVVLPEF